MKDNIPFPAGKMAWFKEKLGIDKNDFKHIESFSQQFVSKKKEFSEYFYDYFSRIDETKFLLTHQRHGENLRKIWENWFESFFNQGFNESFLKALWISGLRHVEINIDHRFIMLSYSILRQFCQEIVAREIPAINQNAILTIIDNMVDFCLLIESNAFLEATSRCDMEVVRGISHQVRNPLTVIGGSVLRLMRNSENNHLKKDIPEICSTIIEESKRLEKMVTDAAAYSDMYQRETDHSIVNLSSLIAGALEMLHGKGNPKLKVKQNISPNDLEIQGGKGDLALMFVNIFQHSIDNTPSGDPDITIYAKQDIPSSSFMEIDIVSKGPFLAPEEIRKVFIPFHSPNPERTGFGLCLAQLAAHKNLGDIYLDEIPDEGIRYIIKLPVPVNDAVSLEP